MLLYAATIFLSAFLLFQVQPVIAKMILPWFGGSAGVWTTCMLFFQSVLLAGYLYSHCSVRFLRPRVATAVHIALLAAGVALLPIVPNPAWKPAGEDNPVLRILGLMAVTVGLPYFLLSTTGPLLQAWFARDPGTSGRSPYRLYALSNLGSMLALLTYPGLVEPYLPTRLQARIWSAGFVAFTLLCSWAALRSRGAEAASLPASADEAVGPGWRQYLVWTLLPACASILLLAVTNHLTQNIASIPFLWIVPLSLYLLTFILCFDSEGWYRRTWFLPLFAVAMGSMAYALSKDSENMPLKLAIPLFNMGLFVCCMVCHGELARLKPHPRYLTGFFLMVSLGGALGGLFVGVVAPNVFPGYYELHVGLAACALLVLLVLRHDPGGPFAPGSSKLGWILAASMFLGLCGFLFHIVDSSLDGSRVAVRNFYGGLTVHDSGAGEEALRVLTHGTINHGQQYMYAGRRSRATTYYSPRSGAGIAITVSEKKGPLHVGVIGLGTGTLAAYGRPGDHYRFYEINPLVLAIARRDFSFTRDSQAAVDFVLGDARLSLEREPDQGFDVLAIDAFSSDAIPVHLLTVEAFRLYFRHLKSDGVLAVHVSNKFLNLKPVVGLAAWHLRKQARMIDTEDNEQDSAIYGATWILVTADPGFFAQPEVKEAASSLRPRRGLRLWTDDFSNLYRIIK